jgi:hypothetical protein
VFHGVIPCIIEDVDTSTCAVDYKVGVSAVNNPDSPDTICGPGSVQSVTEKLRNPGERKDMK